MLRIGTLNPGECLMTAGRVDFIIEQGATFQRTVIWTESDGTPIDITGYSALMKISYVDPTTKRNQLIELMDTGLDPGIVITGPSGQLDITVPADQTAAYVWGSGSYTLTVTSPLDVTTRLLQGNIKICADVPSV
jgi:hypothetical protein